MDAKFLSIRGRLSCYQQSRPFESWIPGEALPALNPIDEAFASVKAYLNQHDKLMQALDDPVSIIKATSFKLSAKSICRVTCGTISFAER